MQPDEATSLDLRVFVLLGCVVFDPICGHMSLSSFHSSCFYRALVKIKRNGSLWGKQISFKIRAKIRSSCFPTCGWREQKSSVVKSCGQFSLNLSSDCSAFWVKFDSFIGSHLDVVIFKQGNKDIGCERHRAVQASLELCVDDPTGL